MNKFLLLTGFLIFSISGYSQEFSAPEGFYIGQREVRPSLSMLADEIPSGNFTLTEVNFNKKQKIEVNLIAMMEQERYEKEKSYITLDAPMPDLGNREKSFIQFSNEVRVHDRSSNFDIYTGKKKIPAYEEMRVPLFSSPYHTRSRIRSYVSPYSYSPYLR